MKKVKDFLQLVSTEERQLEVLIELIQKDAYNSALEDAAKNAKTKLVIEWGGNVGEYTDEYYIVDKSSILNLKIK